MSVAYKNRKKVIKRGQWLFKNRDLSEEERENERRKIGAQDKRDARHARRMATLREQAQAAFKLMQMVRTKPRTRI